MNDAAVYEQSRRDGLDELVTQYLPLVKKTALYWSARLPQAIELDDLMQVGLIGLIQASESYDASQGASFATYASIRIKGAMLDEVRRNDWVPRSVQQKGRQVAAAVHRAEARLGRAPLDQEIAAELDVPLEQYQDMAGELACCRMSSLDDSDAEAAGPGAGPDADTEQEVFRAALVQAMHLLPEKEQLMMSLYYRDELNLKEIGAVLGVSESRVSQIHGQALARLRAHLGDWTG